MKFSEIERSAKAIRVKSTAVDTERILADAEAALAEPGRVGAVFSESRIRIWQAIIGNRMARFTAAALIIVAAVAAILHFAGPIGGASVVFADVIKKIDSIRTVAYWETLYLGRGQGTTYEKMINEAGVIRMVLAHGDIIIIDRSGGRNLHLMPGAKKAVLTQQLGTPREKRLLNYLDWVSRLHEEAAEFAGTQRIDGRITEMFVAKKPFEKTTVWVDPRTNLPVRVELVYTANRDKNIVAPQIALDEGDFGGDANNGVCISISSGRGSGEGIQNDLRVVMSNFVWNAEIDESLFSMEPPEGYAVEERQFDVSERGEYDLIDALAFWTEMSGGAFPSEIDQLGDAKKVRAMLAEKFDRDGDPKEEFEAAVKTANVVLKGLMFVQQRKVEGSWRYAGKGAQIGDGEKAVCWWKSAEGEKYRVIYGDLSASDANETDLPAEP